MNLIKVYGLLNKIKAELKIPGSKSVTNRALLMAAFADGISKIDGVLKSDDCDACIDVLKNIGSKIYQSGDTVEVCGNLGICSRLNAELNLRSSGTLARFLPGLLASVENSEYILDGSSQLKSRPLTPVIRALKQLGADISSDQLPLKINGKKISGGDMEISVLKSTQYASGLLMASPYFISDTKIHITDANAGDENYIMMTYQMMKDFKADVSYDDASSSFLVKTGAYKAREYTIEADFNTANYFLTLAFITGSSVKITNINKNTLQPGILFLELLSRMGAEVEMTDGYVKVSGNGKIKGGFEIDMKKQSEMALTLAAIAPFADAPITMKNIAHIRGHECDRISAMAKNLSALGIKCDEFSDGITVYNGKPASFVKIDTFDDHRVAMAFALTGLKSEGIILENPDCVKKTCPSYFDILSSIGIKVERL